MEYLISIGVVGCVVVLGLHFLINSYFNSQKFVSLRNRVSDNVRRSNDLKQYILDIKSNTGLLTNTIGRRNGVMLDNSVWNFARPSWDAKAPEGQIHECSLSVLNNAKNDPFKYLVKYFNFKIDEPTVVMLEKFLKDLLTVDEAANLIQREENKILNSIANEVPWWIKRFAWQMFSVQLGFTPEQVKFEFLPKYVFSYTSAGGKSAIKYEITFDAYTVEQFWKYILAKLEFKNSMWGQRRLMTKQFREKIKRRDQFTCQKCGNGIHNEPNLLLEVDHIIAVSRGGMSVEENLQTLCWVCNRKKGAN